jgi:hypothetical protein
VLVSHSVTTLDSSATGRVVVAGSHCGLFAAYVAASAGARAVILNDAGVGRDEAGIGGLRWLADLGIPAASTDYRTARIGDGIDSIHRGIISFANEIAVALGCHAGQRVIDAAALLDARAPRVEADIPARHEGRHSIRRPHDSAPAGGIPVCAVDSVSLVSRDDADAIVMCGSHGALLGGDPATALPHDVHAVVFNDAGGGIDDAGFTRLPALDARRIPAATVHAFSARIGDGRSTYHDGIVSRGSRK